MKKHLVISFLLLSIGITTSYSQDLDVDLQLRPRYEYRHGYKDFLQQGEKPASLISNRARLNLQYAHQALQIKVSAQNVSVWGESPIASNQDKNGINLHEAWARYAVNEQWGIKIGRQVIEYDNQRIFGGLDWAQQGQRHDAALVQYNTGKHALDVGFALNNVTDTPTNTPYTINSYKTMQYVWYHTTLNQWEVSLLFLNAGYEYERAINDYTTSYNQTWGTYSKYKGDTFFLSAALYGQTGKTAAYTKEAWYASFDFNYTLSQTLSTQLGFEFLSGKSQDDLSTINKSFTPLFGTSHGFNGLMDYFYSGNHLNSVGLQDLYLKLNYKKDKWGLSLQPHLFYSAGNIYNENLNKMDNYLGTEIDFTVDYQVQKDIKVSGGYSQLFASNSFEHLKNRSNNRDNQWAWVMISINPTLFKTNSSK